MGVAEGVRQGQEHRERGALVHGAPEPVVGRRWTLEDVEAKIRLCRPPVIRRRVPAWALPEFERLAHREGYAISFGDDEAHRGHIRLHLLRQTVAGPDGAHLDTDPPTLSP